MTKRKIITKNAPGAIGPYSQGILAEKAGLIFVSGQLPVDPPTGRLITGTVAELTRRCLENAAAILEEAGSSLKDVVKTTVFLTDMGNFQEMNGEYGRFFPEDPPARSCIAVAGLPLGAAVEIELIAARGRLPADP